MTRLVAASAAFFQCCKWSVQLQVAIHAIGDKANDELAALYRSLPPRGSHSQSSSHNSTASRISRHRIEHVQHLSGPDSLAAIAEAGVVAVTNPLHLVSDLEIIEARLSKGRSKAGLAFPSKALLQVSTLPIFCEAAVVVYARPPMTIKPRRHGADVQ